jgi:hypothetical protein
MQLSSTCEFVQLLYSAYPQCFALSFGHLGERSMTGQHDYFEHWGNALIASPWRGTHERAPRRTIDRKDGSPLVN